MDDCIESQEAWQCSSDMTRCGEMYAQKGEVESEPVLTANLLDLDEVRNSPNDVISLHCLYVYNGTTPPLDNFKLLWLFCYKRIQLGI